MESTVWYLLHYQAVRMYYPIEKSQRVKNCLAALSVQPYKKSSILNQAQDGTKDVITLHAVGE